MAETAIDHICRYPFASEFSEVAGDGFLKLATAEHSQTYPYFFDGRLMQPRPTALLLYTLSRVVGTRFYIPPNMLNRILAERDPVVTSGGGVLRFEGFSACCSAYARVDLTPDAYEGKVVGTGTTNVDFNEAMRAALSAVRDGERVSLAVGPDEVTLKRGFERIVEKKVRLPLRWLKGFAEVQAFQSKMELQASIPKSEAMKFLRSLPRNAHDSSTFYVVPAGKGLRLATVHSGAPIKIGGLSRLKLLQDLAPLADELKIYAHPSGQSSEWQVRCGGLTYSLAVTAEPSRGFSGEGQLLSDLSNASDEHIARVRAMLKWQSAINANAIAEQCRIDRGEVDQCLGMLGSRGLVGYDSATQSYFHRELPFDMELVEEMHPRLKAARKLFADKKVELSQNGDQVKADVQGTDVKHRVVLSTETEQCSCPWHAKYQGGRGPCKHILAVRIAMGDTQF